MVTIGTRKGKRVAVRDPIAFPRDLVRGRLERLSDLQLREARKDLNAEYLRRLGSR